MGLDLTQVGNLGCGDMVDNAYMGKGCFLVTQELHGLLGEEVAEDGPDSVFFRFDPPGPDLKNRLWEEFQYYWGRYDIV